MLQSLYIKNYILIDEVIIDFKQGLNIITGQTGAGKSILLGALSLVLGKRLEGKNLLKQDAKCIIEASFDSNSDRLSKLLDQFDLDNDEQILIRREISKTGKSRAFVNDTPVKLDILRQISTQLIDIHQQFDTLEIMDKSFQLRVIDALAGIGKEVQTYREKYDQFVLLRQEYHSTKEVYQTQVKEQDYHQYILQEIEAIEVNHDELNDLEREWKTLHNAEQIKRDVSNQLTVLFQDDRSVLTQLNESLNVLRRLGDFSSSFTEWLGSLESIYIELNELYQPLEDTLAQVYQDPERLQFVQDRISVINSILNKHRLKSVDDLLAFSRELSEKVDSIEALRARLEAIEVHMQKEQDQLLRIARGISKKRRSSFMFFTSEMQSLLSTLSMTSATIMIDHSLRTELNQYGLDDIQFRFSANKGKEMELLSQVASGGELSRVALCIKSLVARNMDLPTLFFDEIDSGVSGEISKKMAGILKQIAKDHQLVCITHSPQIAAEGDQHFAIYKTESQDQTQTRVKLLSDSERVVEIAMMLDGDPPSQYALQNAKGLLRSI